MNSYQADKYPPTLVVGGSAQLEPYVARMVQEYAENGERLRKLDTFTVTEEFLKLGDEDRRLLMQQSVFMSRYLDVLRLRLGRAGVEVEEIPVSGS